MRDYDKISNKGLSLVEILTAMLLLTTTAAGVYATFLGITKMSSTVRNKVDAYELASKWLEQVRTGATDPTKYRNLATAQDIDLNDAGSILQEDYSTWPLATKSNIKDLSAKYTISDITAPSGLILKKVTITVNWTRE